MVHAEVILPQVVPAEKDGRKKYGDLELEVKERPIAFAALRHTMTVLEEPRRT
jgi:hypothetical protein